MPSASEQPVRLACPMAAPDSACIGTTICSELLVVAKVARIAQRPGAGFELQFFECMLSRLAARSLEGRTSECTGQREERGIEAGVCAANMRGLGWGWSHVAHLPAYWRLLCVPMPIQRPFERSRAQRFDCTILAAWHHGPTQGRLAHACLREAHRDAKCGWRMKCSSCPHGWHRST